MLTTQCPWKEHLLDLEIEHGVHGQVKYCVFGVRSEFFWKANVTRLLQEEGKDCRVQAVPVEVESFLPRMPLPERWRALRGNDLDRASGIEGCVFVHASGFIGGHATIKGALAMAEKSLALAKQQDDAQ